MKTKLLVFLATLALCLSASTVSATGPDLLVLTNQDRVAAGQSALTLDSYLSSKAQSRAQDMIDRDYFSHNIPPDGHLVFADMTADGYCFRIAAENIGLWLNTLTPQEVEAAFMASSEHRTILLGSSWTVMGFGSATGSNGYYVVVALFALPCEVPAPTAPPEEAAQCLVLVLNLDGSTSAPCALVQPALVGAVPAVSIQTAESSLAAAVVRPTPAITSTEAKP